MSRRAAARQGEIHNVNLNPTAGSEIQGLRPVLVLSNHEFNKGGRALVAPITQAGNFERVAGWSVNLTGSGTTVQGAAVISQCRVLDLAACGARRIDLAPRFVIDEALGKLEAMTAYE